MAAIEDMRGPERRIAVGGGLSRDGADLEFARDVELRPVEKRNRSARCAGGGLKGELGLDHLADPIRKGCIASVRPGDRPVCVSLGGDRGKGDRPEQTAEAAAGGSG